MSKITIQVPCNTDYFDHTCQDHEVDARVIQGGLALHRTVGSKSQWTLTHIASGYGTWNNIPSLAIGKQLMNKVLPLLDWELGKEKVQDILFNQKDKTINNQFKVITKELGLTNQ